MRLSAATHSLEILQVKEAIGAVMLHSLSLVAGGISHCVKKFVAFWHRFESVQTKGA